MPSDLSAPAAPAIPAITLRPRDAARALGVCERVLWQMTKEEDIPHFRVGRLVLYPVAELTKWAGQRAQQHAGGADDDAGKA